MNSGSASTPPLARIAVSLLCRVSFICLTLGALITTLQAQHAAAPSAMPGTVRWRAVDGIPASEAFQAAAADERSWYAISSTQVARYDRQTGERLAVSVGDAQHLNSGFFWESQLYCAHSNYPRTPELSQILVLDPETMQLSAARDFGDYGGSLTWVVRRGEHWWCHFARYGSENRSSFLVQFDDQWRELHRWLYPESLIAELGQYSLSGGLWLDDDLLVTGHDDPVLFRLRLPREGNVLEVLDRQSIPFTGQGIALDPRTGGLVGIHRAQRRIILAQREDRLRPRRLRILTYNIHHGEGTDGRIDLERIARVIQTAEPDLVALQEVDCRTRRSGGVDQPAELARLTKMHVAFGRNIAFDGGDYGNAVLSRWPIRRQQNHLLPNLNDGEQRGVLDVEVEFADGLPLRLLATHLDHRPADRERIASARTINALFDPSRPIPALLAGDLNDTPESAALAEVRRRWHSSSQHPTPTFPVNAPQRQIDYVFFAPVNRWKPLDTQVLSETVASDHRPLLAELELLPPTDE